MHEYESQSFTAEQESLLRSRAGVSQYHEDFLTQDEFDLCRDMTLSVNEWPEHGAVSKYWGFGWDSGLGPRLTWLQAKIDRILPDWQLDFLAVQEAINPWKIHADIRWYADRIPYKVILMPMDVEPLEGPVPVDQWPETNSIVFHQRSFLSRWPEHLAKQKSVTGNHQDRLPRPIDNVQYEGFETGFHVTKDQWQQYLSHMPYENMEGLTLDGIHPWRPRSLFMWDNTALHCADNFLASGIRTKRCLMLFTILRR